MNRLSRANAKWALPSGSKVGVALLAHCYERGWARRRKGTRIVDFTARGEREFRSLFEA